MAENITKFNESYTREISGEYFEYQVEYTAGEHVEWCASVYHDAVLKGKPSGSIASNTLKDDALKQYLVSCIEGIIESGLGIEE
jgi:hypothetical protein